MKRWFLYLTVFFTGLCVTAIELTASRFLAPYFGASIFVWANVIGVVLLALSLGYFWGGKLADRFPDPKKLFSVILITGILTDLIPIVGRPYLSFSSKFFAGSMPGLVIGSFIATTIIFAIPLLLLGMMSPWIIRIAAHKINEIGTIAGKVYGISTVGSIIGVFLPVFLTIPFLGSQKTFLIFGTVLIIIAVLGLKLKKLSIFVLLSAFLFALPSGVLKKDIFTIAHAETLYNYLRVNQYPDGERRLIINEGRGVQSIYYPDKFLTGYYWDYAAILPILNPEGKNMLMLGLAGGTSVRTMLHYFPEIHIDAVEIDPKIVEFAKQYFDIQNENLTVFVEDGRIFLKHSDKKYDFVMIDVYAQELSIPFHLATTEFFGEIKDHLSENGIIMMNVASNPGKSRWRKIPSLVQNLQNTFAKVFPENRVLKVEGTGNFLLFGRAERSEAFLIKKAESYPFELKRLYRVFQNFSKTAYHETNHTYFTDDKSSIEWNLP